MKFDPNEQTPRLKKNKEAMVTYDETKSQEDQQWVRISKIVVPTQFDKEQLLRAFHYIHYLPCIDTDFIAVNLLAHMYQEPDLIEVEENGPTGT